MRARLRQLLRLVRTGGHANGSRPYGPRGLHVRERIAYQEDPDDLGVRGEVVQRAVQGDACNDGPVRVVAAKPAEPEEAFEVEAAGFDDGAGLDIPGHKAEEAIFACMHLVQQFAYARKERMARGGDGFHQLQRQLAEEGRFLIR